MKTIVMGVLLTVASLCQAAVEFKSNTELSTEVQAKMVQAIHSQCQMALEDNWSIFESQTVQQKLNSGLFIRSTFAVYGSSEDDRFQPENGEMTIEALVSPTAVQVLRIEGLCH